MWEVFWGVPNDILGAEPRAKSRLIIISDKRDNQSNEWWWAALIWCDTTWDEVDHCQWWCYIINTNSTALDQIFLQSPQIWWRGDSNVFLCSVTSPVFCHRCDYLALTSCQLLTHDVDQFLVYTFWDYASECCCVFHLDIEKWCPQWTSFMEHIECSFSKFYF